MTTDIHLLATMKETQSMLRLSRPTIYDLIRAGELECLHVGRSLRLTTKSINAYLERRLAAEKRKRGGSS